MALARVKTWISGEVLTASDLNAEYNNILNNPVSLISPLTAALDCDGFTLTLDAAAVTTVVSSAAISWNFTSGAKTGTPATTGSVANWSAQTFTDNATAASGTATAFVAHGIQRPTLAATNAGVTTTDAATWYIANNVAAGTNETITNSWAIWVDAGNVRFDDDIYWRSGTSFNGIFAHNISAARTWTFPDVTGTVAIAAEVLALAGGTMTGDITMTAASIVEAEGAAVASAATTNIWATDGNTIHVTGTVTITSFGTAPQAGAWMKVIFDGALTLTHGANLNLPGSANITTAANDFCFVYADTTTLFRCAYFKANGTAVVAASAGTHEVSLSAGNGFGSTNNKIRRFTTTLLNVGTAITYADSATLGASFTINEAGIYAITYSDSRSSGASDHGVSLNSSQLTTGINTITNADIVAIAESATAGVASAVRTLRLAVNDIIRPHSNDGAQDNTGVFSRFSIIKVAT